MGRLAIDCLLVFGFFLGTSCGDFSLPKPERSSGKIWVFLAAGSKGWTEYRHQADIYHAYHIVRRNRIPNENIVVMVNDDIAHHDSNPTPGVVINYPGGPNVYEGLLKDYTGLDVTPINFLNILTGNKTAMEGIGSGKVIESGPDDVIFLNFVGHGTHGVLMFPNNQLFADDFINAIKNMKNENRFSKMVIYIEACFAGSLFDNMLPDDINVFVVTAADSREPSSGCFRDDEQKTWLSNVFSTLWMSFAEHESFSEESLHHLYEKVRSYTNTSHPQEYGDLDLGEMKLKYILGQRKKKSRRRMPPYTPLPTDVVNSMDIPLQIIIDQIRAATDPVKKKQLKWDHKRLIERRESVDKLFNDIMEKVVDNDKKKLEELRTLKLGLNEAIFKCYKTLYTTFSEYCMNPSQNPYSSLHFQKLVNMCTVDWLPEEKAKRDIMTMCTVSYGAMKPKDIV
ncbi:legumain [Halyomorpha halys]|uniref:legumain n=1 Tax=Halyomorpha halys TaxID=286706 RepID=UPI0006D522BC|nr:legumain [Halyomorpha halys]